MAQMAAIAEVRREIEVELPQAEAFRLFTEEAVAWWPPDHSIARKPIAAIVMEPWVGGRQFEVSDDGTTCDWGKVLVYDPPRRVVTSWHLNGNWQFDADPERASEVEVTFVALGELATRVELVHSRIERHEAAEVLAAGVAAPGGWTMTLVRLRDEAKRRASK